MSRKTRRNQPDPGAPQSQQAIEAGIRRRTRLLMVFGAALLLVIGAGIFWSQWDSGGSPEPDDTAARMAAAASIGAPTLGDEGAKVHIVEFIDPACETCAAFFPKVKELLAANPGRIRVSIRHLAFHTGADYAVRVLEASRRQGKYWQTLEALLGSQSQWAVNHSVQQELVLPAIAHVGLDIERLEADMNAPEVAQRMQQDRGDAVTLKVTATPEYYVNGRPLPSFGLEQLQNLVREELEKAY